MDSSLISSIEIRDAFALAHYPKHAAAITSMRLWMCPFHGKAHMEPPCMVTWLQSTSAISKRLAAVTSVRVELPESVADGEVQPMEPAIMDSLVASIGQACPSLRMDGIDRDNEELVRAMFTAIGQHLPGIVELQLGLDTRTVSYNWDIDGIDWAACLPRGLQKFSSEVFLHHELLQQLVLMPSLTEVAVGGLSDDNDTTEVQSGGCAWRVLQIGGFEAGYPSCDALGRFTAAMPLLHLYCDDPFYWELNASSQVEAPAVAKAATWLSQISNCPKELAIGWGDESIPDTASTAGVISALAPLSGLVSLALSFWPVTERTLDELALALPNVSKLTVESSCSISSGAWLRMSSLTSVTDLTINRRSGVGNTIPLAQIIAFVSAVSHPMTLTFYPSSGAGADQAGWEAFKETLEEQRRSTGLPVICSECQISGQIRIITGTGYIGRA